MSTSVNITSTAADDKGGMTMDELEQFVARAKSAEVPGDCKIKVDVGMRMQIKSLSTR